MQKVSLRDFARTARFGPVTIGQHRDQIEDAFGPPPDWGLPPAPPERAAIWKYGTTEFHFNGDILRLIHADAFDVPEGSASVDLDRWVLRRGLPLPDFESALDDAGISHAREAYPWEAGVTLVRTAADVCFLFIENGAAPGARLSAFWPKADGTAA